MQTKGHKPVRVFIMLVALLIIAGAMIVSGFLGAWIRIAFPFAVETTLSETRAAMIRWLVLGGVSLAVLVGFMLWLIELDERR